MKNGNISTENQPKGSARNPSDTAGGSNDDSRTKTGVKGPDPKPSETTQANADVSDVVKNVKRRD